MPLVGLSVRGAEQSASVVCWQYPDLVGTVFAVRVQVGRADDAGTTPSSRRLSVTP
jgi:hypothetical protein